MKRVLICGSRDWTDKELIKSMIPRDAEVVIHGAARGADVLAGECAKELGIPVIEFPAKWSQYGLSAGPKRNQQMLDEGKPTEVIAFSDHLQTSRGTSDMIRRAEKANIRVTKVRHS
jgi:hypothetical protein